MKTSKFAFEINWPLPWKHMWHQYVHVVDLPTCNNDTFLTCFHMGSWMLFCHRKINNASTIPLKKEKEKKEGSFMLKILQRMPNCSTWARVLTFFFKATKNQSVDDMACSHKVLTLLRFIKLKITQKICLVNFIDKKVWNRKN